MNEYKKKERPKGEISVVEISKGGSEAVNRNNVIYLNIVNETAFEVIVKDRKAGNIRIASGKNIPIFSFPSHPFDFNAMVEFNVGAPDTDYITFFINSIGDEFDIKEC